MVSHSPVIYSCSLAGCSGGGRQQSVDKYIDSTWKEIQNLSMTTNMYFLVIETFHSSVPHPLWLTESFYRAAQLRCLTFKALCQVTPYTPRFTGSDSFSLPLSKPHHMVFVCLLFFSFCYYYYYYFFCIT